MMGPKKRWVEKNFVSKRSLSKKIFWVQKFFWSKKIKSKKNFWVPKNFRVPNNFVLKNPWAQQNFGCKNIWSTKMLVKNDWIEFFFYKFINVQYLLLKYHLPMLQSPVCSPTLYFHEGRGAQTHHGKIHYFFSLKFCKAKNCCLDPSWCV